MRRSSPEIPFTAARATGMGGTRSELDSAGGTASESGTPFKFDGLLVRDRHGTIRASRGIGGADEKARWSARVSGQDELAPLLAPLLALVRCIWTYAEFDTPAG